MSKTYTVVRNVLSHGAWNLKKGDAVPADVPEPLIAAWVKGKHIAEAKPADAEKKKT